MRKSNLIWVLFTTLFSMNGFALVFENDQRSHVYQSTDPRVLELSKSVFTFIPKANLIKQADGSFGFLNRTPLKTLVNLCPEEAHAEDVSIGTRCSGFLVSSKLGLTAGHCVSPELVPDFCNNYYVIFDYIQNNAHHLDQLPAESVRECKAIKKLVFSKSSATDDYAVIELSQPILDRKPLKYRKFGRIQAGEEIFMLGYPRGMPQMISENRVVLEGNNPSFFATNLDCFRGNSGSPVFNRKTHSVEGIFVRGDGFIPNQSNDPNLVGDFFPDESAGCNRTLICKRQEGCTAAMYATRATRVRLR